jgi:DNA-binding NarL/FixJ family response regulator
VTPQTKSSRRGRTRVLIVDDHPMVRERIAEVVNREPNMEVCGEANEAGQTMATIARLEPDLVLLDLNLKGILALDLIRDIKARHPTLPVVIVSMHEETIFAERAIRSGANGYVSKEDPSQTVIHAIRKVLLGETYMSERLASHFAQVYLHGTDKTSPNFLERLSDRELEVMELIGRGLSNRRVAGKLHIDIRTVETHCARIREKLDLHNSTELLMRAIEWVQSRGSR